MDNGGPSAARVAVLGVAFDAVGVEAAAARLASRSPDAPFAAVVTLNAEEVARLRRDGAALDHGGRSAWLRLNASRTLSLVARLSGRRLATACAPAIVRRLLEEGAVAPDTPICVVGGGAALRDVLRARFGLRNVTHVDAPFGLRESATARLRVVEAVEAGRYRFTLLARGGPEQALIAAALHDRGRARGVGVCVGDGDALAAALERPAPRGLWGRALAWTARAMADPRGAAQGLVKRGAGLVRLGLSVCVRPAPGAAGVSHAATHGASSQAPRADGAALAGGRAVAPRRTTADGVSWTSYWREAPTLAEIESVGGAGARRRGRDAARERSGARARRGPPELVARGLLFAFVIYLFVGVGPLTGSLRAPSGMLDKLIVMGMCATAVVLIARQWRLALRVMARRVTLWVLLAFAVLSVTWSIAPSATVLRVMNVGMLTIAAFAAALTIGRPRNAALTLLAAFSCVMAIDAAVFLLDRDFAFAFNGFRGAHASKNMAGFALMIMVVFAGIWTLNQTAWRSRLLGAVVFAAAAFILVATVSKTSMGLTAVALAVVFPLAMASYRNVRVGIALLLAGLLSLGVAAVAAGAAGWGHEEVFTLVFGDPTFTNRTDIWAFVVDDIASRPWLGFGYGAYWDVTGVFNPLDRFHRNTWFWLLGEGDALNQAHNGYLDLWLQLGVLGPVLGLWTFCGAAWTSLVGYLTTRPRTETHALMGASFVLLTCFLLHNLMEASMMSRMIPSGLLMVFFVFMVDREALAKEAAATSGRRLFASRPYAPQGVQAA